MSAPHQVLIQDESFDFELNRVIAHSRYRGADTYEVLQLRSAVSPGDYESWYNAFVGLADGVVKSAPSTSHLVSYADSMFAAANYYRTADFFLHGNKDDPRIMELWKKQTECFDAALNATGQGTRLEIQADGFKVPIIYFRNAHNLSKAPTIIIGNGFDGAMEEMYHISGIAALERGYNVILYEGPGQPTVRRYQGLGFIHDWERVVTPVVDFALSQPEVNAEQIALYGYSMGGYLVLRTAAFEHRLAAIVAIDGVMSLSNFISMPEIMSKPYEAGDKKTFNEVWGKIADDKSYPTGFRWGFSHGIWSFNVANAWDFKRQLTKYSAEDVVDKVKCKAFIGDAESDMFFKGQPEKVVKALGDKAQFRYFSKDEGALLHCQVGAARLLNTEVFDWLEDEVFTKA